MFVQLGLIRDNVHGRIPSSRRGEVQLLRIVQEEEAEKLMVECFSKNFIDYEVSKTQSSS
jgi:hypothetical protein